MAKEDIKEILKEKLGITNKDLEDKEESLLRIRFLDKNKVEERIKFYMKEFNLTKAELSKMVIISPAIISYSEESVRTKESFYMEEFNITKEEFRKMVKSWPTLLGLNKESIQSKVSFYLEEFNLTKKEFGKMFKIAPSLLSYKIESVLAKKAFYIKEFNLKNEEFCKMVKSFPGLIGYREDSVRAKKLFYMEEFNLTHEEFNKMVKISPGLLSLDKDSIINKHKTIKELQIGDGVLVQHPDILAAPEKSLKVRYMILYIVNGSDSFLNRSGWQRTSHKKTWARLCGLREMKILKIRSRDLIIEEKTFVKKFNINSITLMKRYPFIEEAVKQIKAEYGQIAKKTEGLDINLSEEELSLDK